MKKTKTKPTSTIGGNLKKIRINRGINRPELAKFVGVTDQLLYSWEVGRIRLPAEKLPKLAEYLECSVVDILGIRENGHG